MAGLLLRDIPEALHEKIRKRALANRRSLASEAIVILQQALDDRAGPPSLEEIDAIRVRGTGPLTQELLDKAREQGRP